MKVTLQNNIVLHRFTEIKVGTVFCFQSDLDLNQKNCNQKAFNPFLKINEVQYIELTKPYFIYDFDSLQSLNEFNSLRIYDAEIILKEIK